LDTLVNRALEKWPWLDDEAEASEDAGEMVHIGATSYFGADPQWTRFGEQDHEGPRIPTDPVFVLDALGAIPSPATPIATEPVRGVATTRYDTTIDLGAAADQTPERIRRPPHGGHSQRGAPWTMRANVWVDDDGLIRRATHTILPLYRPSQRRAKPPSHEWTTVEFWDFGLPVNIPTPQIEDPPSTLLVIYGLWQRRRQYRRDHPSGGSGENG
jgi:hypothetical protein